MARLKKLYTENIRTKLKDSLGLDNINNVPKLEKIILIDVQNKIYPDLEKSLLDLLHNSGYPGIKFDKKVAFENLYKQKFN